MEQKQRRVYIVITQSGSILSKILKIVTRAPYNHVSLSLNTDLHVMYSFGRLKPKNPVIGGFVKESPFSGTFARFSNTKALVLYMDVSEKQYEAMERHLQALYNRKDQYKYDVIGLLLAAFRVKYTRKNRYYCSEWVKEMMLRHKLAKKADFKKITKPIHFLDLKEANLIFKGKLQDYSRRAACSLA